MATKETMQIQCRWLAYLSFRLCPIFNRCRVGVERTHGLACMEMGKIMKLPINSITIMIFATILSACAVNSPTSAPNLEGVTWVLTGYNQTRPIAGTQPTIQFTEDQVSGNAGCNHYGGNYQIQNDAIHFDAIFSTEMACQDPAGVMDQEKTYLALLRSADRFKLADGVITLFSGPDQVLTFEMKKDH
jgi:heat shock protein HslJ